MADTDKETPAPPAREIGFLICIVLEARGLVDKSRIGKQDPFCRVELSNSGRGETPVDRRGGQTPAWDHEFRFNAKQVGDQLPTMDVAVYAKGYREDELVGRGQFTVRPDWPDTHFDEWVALKDTDDQFCGEVYIECTFYPPLEPKANLVRHPSKWVHPTKRPGPVNGAPMPSPTHNVAAAPKKQAPPFPPQRAGVAAFASASTSPAYAQSGAPSPSSSSAHALNARPLPMPLTASSSTSSFDSPLGSASRLSYVSQHSNATPSPPVTMAPETRLGNLPFPGEPDLPPIPSILMPQRPSSRTSHMQSASEGVSPALEQPPHSYPAPPMPQVHSTSPVPTRDTPFTTPPPPPQQQRQQHNASSASLPQQYTSMPLPSSVATPAYQSLGPAPQMGHPISAPPPTGISPAPAFSHAPPQPPVTHPPTEHTYGYSAPMFSPPITSTTATAAAPPLPVISQAPQSPYAQHSTAAPVSYAAMPPSPQPPMPQPAAPQPPVPQPLMPQNGHAPAEPEYAPPEPAYVAPAPEPAFAPHPPPEQPQPEARQLYRPASQESPISPVSTFAPPHPQQQQPQQPQQPQHQAAPPPQEDVPPRVSSLVQHPQQSHQRASSPAPASLRAESPRPDSRVSTGTENRPPPHVAKQFAAADKREPSIDARRSPSPAQSPSRAGSARVQSPVIPGAYDSTPKPSTSASFPPVEDARFYRPFTPPASTSLPSPAPLADVTPPSVAQSPVEHSPREFVVPAVRDSGMSPKSRPPLPTPPVVAGTSKAAEHTRGSARQLEIIAMIEQERRDAELAASLYNSATEEEKARLERERLDEEFARKLELDGADEARAEERRRREAEDEAFARQLAEADC